MKKPTTIRISMLVALLLSSYLLFSQNITKPNIQGPMPGIQVHAYNGNLLCQRSDLFIPAQGPDIDITFSYNSGKTLIDYGFGFGWTFTCNIAYELDGQDVIIRREDGRKDIFSFDGTDYKAPIGFFDTLTQYLPNQYRLRAKNGLTCFFDDSLSQRVTKMEDRYGNTLIMAYNGQEISTITDASGRSIHFTWIGGRMTKITDPNFSPQREILYQYDGNGMPVQVTDAIGNTTKYSYDNERKITQVTDKRGTPCNITYNTKKAVSGITSPITTQTITYDAQNLEVKLTEEVGGGTRVTTYTYDTNGNVINTENPCCSSGLNLEYEYDADRNMTKFTDGNSNIYTYTYDNNGNRLSETDPLSETRSWTYEPVFNRMNSSTDKNGNTTNNTYDANGNLIESNRPESITESYTYDSFGNRTSYTDGNGNATTFAYNTNGDLTAINYPIGTEAFTYDNVGNQLTATDANGNTTTFEYDKLNRLTKITDGLSNETIQTYDANGNQISLTDGNGHTTTFAYDILDRQTEINQPLGITTKAKYDQLGNLIEMTDPSGNKTIFSYNAQNLVETEADALGNSKSYTYDGNGNLLTETDLNGNTTTNAYDSLNRLISVTDALFNTVTFIYDANDNQISTTDANGNTTTIAFDSLDREVSITDALSNTTVFTYDSSNNVVTQLDANNGLTVMAYDANNRLVSTTNPLSGLTTVSYDNNGNRLSISDPLGHTTTFAYDALNQGITEVNAEQDITSFTYDAVGNVITQSLPNGNVITNTYDSIYRQIKEVDLVGDIGSWTYDLNSNVLSESDGNGNPITYTYDNLNRVVSKTDREGETASYTYDNNSNVVSETDRNGNTTSHTFDALNRVESITNPLTNTVSFGYDANGNTTSVTDENSNTTTYTFDSLNRIILVTYADTTTESNSFDPMGNLISRTNQNGVTINFTYDELDQLIKRDYPSSNDDVFAYDDAGRMLSANNANATISYTYDDANRKLTEVQNGKTVTCSYDIPGREVTIQYPGGRLIKEKLDLRDRLEKVEEGATTFARYEYDNFDRMTLREYANGVKATPVYNNINWMTSVVHQKGAATIAGFNYSYDKEGNRLSEEKTHKTTNSEQYDYDNLYRLVDYKKGTLSGATIGTPTTGTTYAYDNLGNRTSINKDSSVTTYSSNSVNEYTAITTGSTFNPVYDNNGNLLFDGNHTYTYDLENRIVAVDGGIIASYKYDARGRRVQKIAGGIPTNYYYDGARVIEERDFSDTVTATFVYGIGMDGPITLTRASETFYYHQNSIGSISAVTDTAGNVVERYEYDGYGAVTVFDSGYVQISAPTIDHCYLFQGRRLDFETGLYFYRARHYDPNTGRFLQRDPLGYVDGLNLYAYVMNNPQNLTDPLGLAVCKEKILGCISKTLKKEIRFNSEFKIKVIPVEVNGKIVLKWTNKICGKCCNDCSIKAVVSTGGSVKVELDVSGFYGINLWITKAGITVYGKVQLSGDITCKVDLCVKAKIDCCGNASGSITVGAKASVGPVYGGGDVTGKCTLKFCVPGGLKGGRCCASGRIYIGADIGWFGSIEKSWRTRSACFSF